MSQVFKLLCEGAMFGTNMAPLQSNWKTPPRTLGNQLKYSTPIPIVPEKDPKAYKMNKINVKLRCPLKSMAAQAWFILTLKFLDVTSIPT